MCLLSQTDRIFILIEYFKGIKSELHYQRPFFFITIITKECSLMGLSQFNATQMINLKFEKVVQFQMCLLS